MNLFRKLIIGLFTVGILALLRTMYSPDDHFVSVAAKSVPKSVSIRVTGIVQVRELELKDGHLHISIATRTASYLGAGVFISPNNHVLTCHHLFTMLKVTGITVCTNDGNCTAGELLYAQERVDLALVQSNFDKPTPYAKIADARSLKVGQDVIAVGNPLGLDFTVTHGIISALNRSELGVQNMTQADVAINPGNSGGPLFNIRGELVGINSRILPPVPANIFTGLGFSVSPTEMQHFLDIFRSIGSATQLGLS